MIGWNFYTIPERSKGLIANLLLSLGAFLLLTGCVSSSAVDEVNEKIDGVIESINEVKEVNEYVDSRIEKVIRNIAVLTEALRGCKNDDKKRTRRRSCFNAGEIYHGLGSLGEAEFYYRKSCDLEYQKACEKLKK